MERRVFISYSRRDQNRVLPFVEQLRAAGYHPWLDQRSIPVSVPWLAEINHAIRSAELAIVMDSPHWRASTNCATEATMLRQLGKSVVALDVSSDAATWLDTVNSSYAQVAPAELVRAELLGDSDRWVAAGRPASHLPTGGTLRAFKRIAPAARDGVSEEFLRAARGLTRRKRVLGVLAGLLTFLLWTSWRSAIEMETAVEKTYAERLANLADVTAVTNQISSDPYLGLRAAIAHMDRDPGSFTSRWVLSEALDVSLPTQLTRGSDARAATLGPVTSSSGYRASYDTARRRVRIEAPDHQVTYVGSGVSNVLAWAPEEPTLAIGQSTGILIVDARTGAVVNTLRGLRDTVTSMQWNSDDELVASDGTFRATWTTHSAKLLGTTNAWFMRMASNADRTRSLAVARDGSYVVLDGNRVGDRQTISGAVQGLAVGWVGDRWIVGSRDRSGKGTLAGIADDGRVVDQMGIGDCQPS